LLPPVLEGGLLAEDEPGVVGLDPDDEELPAGRIPGAGVPVLDGGAPGTGRGTALATGLTPPLVEAGLGELGTLDIAVLNSKNDQPKQIPSQPKK
jgi:hypothetical protein